MLEVLWLTALACVMGNVVDVEQAQNGGTGLESFEDNLPARLPVLV